MNVNSNAAGAVEAVCVKDGDTILIKTVEPFYYHTLKITDVLLTF